MIWYPHNFGKKNTDRRARAFFDSSFHKRKDLKREGARNLSIYKLRRWTLWTDIRPEPQRNVAKELHMLWIAPQRDF